MTAGPLLELAGVSKRFGSIIVADSLSLVVRGGDAVGMVGPNGAGKTSLFSLISGDLSPNSGEVHFEGRAVTGDSLPVAWTTAKFQVGTACVV